MKPTRRDLALFFPTLALATPAEAATLPSKVFKFEDLPVRASGTGGANQSRAIMHGELHNGFPLEVHETELAPGGSPHPPHRHVHKEMFVVLQGQVDFTVNGVTTRLTPGSIGFAASNDLHGVMNPSNSVRCRYTVLEMGEDK